MTSPFKKNSGQAYSAVPQCILRMIFQQQAGVMRATKQKPKGDWSCGICQDLLVDGKNTAHKLVNSMLECKHVFHEYCLMQWLSPIQLHQSPSVVPGPRSGIAFHLFLPALVHRVQHVLRGRYPNLSPEQIGRQQQILIQEYQRRSVLSRESTAHREQTGGSNSDSEGGRTTLQRPQQLGNGNTEENLISSGARLRDNNVSGEGESHERPPNRGTGNLLINPPSRRQTRRDNPKAPKYCCPLCRQTAFEALPTCCSDSVQLLRVRRRLTDFVFGLLGFQRNEEEKGIRDIIIWFLDRRYADTVALKEVESIPPLLEARRIFSEARRALVAHGDYHIRYSNPSAAEQESIKQMTMVFENFNLEEGHVRFFFDPTPELDTSNFKVELSEEDMRVLKQCPIRFFSELEIVLTASSRVSSTKSE
ncbi:MAG: hypothetical protein Q9185_004489 [Variospora sp. 1 TL-2023]